MAQAQATVKLLDWMLSPEAQALTTKVHYSPLPQSAVANAKTLLNSIDVYKRQEYERAQQEANARIDAIIKDLKLQ